MNLLSAFWSLKDMPFSIWLQGPTGQAHLMSGLPWKRWWAEKKMSVAEAWEWGLYPSLSAVLNDSLFSSPAEPQGSLLLSLIIFGLEKKNRTILHNTWMSLNYKYAVTAGFLTAFVYTLISALKLSPQNQEDERQIRCGKIRSQRKEITMCPGQLPWCRTILCPATFSHSSNGSMCPLLCPVSQVPAWRIINSEPCT